MNEEAGQKEDEEPQTGELPQRAGSPKKKKQQD